MQGSYETHIEPVLDIQLVACEDVPVEARPTYALATYFYLRGGELKALTCEGVDVERGIISLRRSYDRQTGRIKQTKTGNKGIRRFAVESVLLPPLETMHADRRAGPGRRANQQQFPAQGEAATL